MSRRRFRTVTVLMVAFLVGACGGQGPENEATGTASPPPDGDRVEGGLHACATGLPVPDQLTVVESVRTPVEEDYVTCVVTMETGSSPAEVITAYQATLEEAGWRFNVPHADEGSALLQLEAPDCGVVMTLASEAAGRPEAGASTTVFVSLIPCDRMPDAPN